MSHDPELPADFAGTARLFPLPNAVLFPHAILPLHVFEPRYRQLLTDALADDRLFALALLRPGWEEDYDKSPAIHPVVCVGHILQEQRLPDGRFTLLLQGLARARVRAEVPTGKLYRTARVEVLHDVACPAADSEPLQRRLGQRVSACFATEAAALEQVQRLLDGRLSLAALCDVLAFALPFELPLKQRLLEEPRVAERARLLLERLETLTPQAPRRFPPDFSSN
jgi:Lon protease-like protein